MDKITYLAELAEGLARWVPEREREDILRYYAEYFEEAGPGREAEVVAELGDPWALSCRLAVEGGYVTWEKAASWRHKIKWPKILFGTAVGLAVFTLVFGFGLLAVNVVRTVSNPVRSVSVAAPTAPTVPPGMFVQIEPVQDQVFVSGEYGVEFIDGSEFAGYVLADDALLEVFDSIDVDVSLGNIQVVAGDSFNLSVGWNDAMIGYEPSWEVRDGVLRIRAGSGPRVTKAFVWNDLTELFRVDQLVVDVILTVPKNAVLDKISVKTGLGDVLLCGVSAETVAAETGLGNVECYDARNVRRLDLNTGAGNMNLDMEKVRSGLSIGLKSGTGNVEVNLGCSESDCQYKLESGLGLVTVNGAVRGSSAERRGGTHCSLAAASGTGSVNVHFISG